MTTPFTPGDTTPTDTTPIGNTSIGTTPTERSFDFTQPLAPRTLIEASAGTGKTYALCGLVTYLIGSGQATVDDFLVVTYTNLATEDLRARIRSRIATVRDALRASSTPNPEPSDPNADKVALALAEDGAATDRLDAALRAMGDLTVSTIHGFAQKMLTQLGPTMGIDPDRALLSDASSLIEEVIADELSTIAFEFAHGFPDRSAHEWIPDAGAVVDIVNMIGNVPDLRLIPEVSASTFTDLVTAQPESDPADSMPFRVGWVARRVVDKALARRVAGSVRTFSDLLVDLRGVVQAPEGAAARALVRSRHRFVLIDEFQDTDRVQWDIFGACFGTGKPDDPSRLVVVGDPKQAIYRFRGADVHLFGFVAGRSDVDVYRQQVNHRSDAALLQGLNAVLSGTHFGEGAAYLPVRATDAHRAERIRWRDSSLFPPVRITVDSEPSSANDARALAIDDAVAWIARLTEQAELVVSSTEPSTDSETDSSTDAATRVWRPVGFEDIAVLVRSGPQALQLAGVLRRAGIPCAIHATDDDVRTDRSRNSFLAGAPPSEALFEWQLLLGAIAEPSDIRRARAAATGIFGPDLPEGDAAEALADSDAIATFQRELSEWARALSRTGPAELLALLKSDTDWLRRATSRADGGRLATDLGHIGELLITTAGSGSTSPDRLLEALAPKDKDAVESTVTSRRLASDAPAVTIMTIHKAKGLEFPIVGCIGLDDTRQPKAARFHESGTDPDDPGSEVLDLYGLEDSAAYALTEEQDDAMRVAYVALTRAQHHMFTHWSLPNSTDLGALSRILVGHVTESETTDPDTDAWSTLDENGIEAVETEIRDRSRDPETGRPTVFFTDPLPSIATKDPSPAPGRSQSRQSDDITTLEVARLPHELDRRFQRWAYSTITDRAHSGSLGSSIDAHQEATPGSDEGVDERTNPDDPATSGEGTNAQPLTRLTRGTGFGTLVHRVLQYVDFAAEDLEGALRRCVDSQLGSDPMELIGSASQPEDPTRSGRELLVEGLTRAVRAPLGAGGSDLALPAMALADVTSANRLSECRFHLRLDTSASAAPTGRAIGQILVDGLAEDDPFLPWARRLFEGRFDLDLYGHLTGELDLVFRVPGADGDQRFFVADYKTNALDSYQPQVLIGSMVEHDYPLQALLYTVALHRYLRWRVDGYEPERHLGGAVYLFLRGMTGDVPSPGCAAPGVVHWRLDSTVVERLDALFAGDVDGAVPSGVSR